MEKLSPCKLVSDFRENNKEAIEYVDVINELLLSYTKTQEYSDTIPEKKEQLHKDVQDVKELLRGIGNIPAVDRNERCMA